MSGEFRPVTFKEEATDENFSLYSSSLIQANKKIISNDSSNQEKKKSVKEIKEKVPDFVEVGALPERKRFDYLLTSMHAVHGLIYGSKRGWLDEETADEHLETIKKRLGDNWKEALNIFKKFHGDLVDNIREKVPYEVDPEITFHPDNVEEFKVSGDESDFERVRETSVLMNEAEEYLRKHEEKEMEEGYDDHYRHEYFWKVEEMLEEFFELEKVSEDEVQDIIVTTVSLANHVRKAEDLGGISKNESFNYLEALKKKVGEDRWEQEIEGP